MTQSSPSRVVETWRSGYTVIDVLILTAAAGALAIRESREWLPNAVAGHEGDIYVALATVAATLLGFVVAAITILLTVGGRRLTKTYMASRLYGKTLGLFHVTAVWLSLTTFVALAGLFVDESSPGTHPAEWRSRWIWLMVALALVAAWRFVFSLSILKGVVDLVVDDKQPRTTKEARPPDDELTAAL